jgi:hypothetical protein
MTRITDEAVEAAAKAIFDDEWRPGDWTWDQYGSDSRYHYRARTALDAALPHLEGATPAIDREALDDVLRTHTIECTGPGEVTCRGCRDSGWMSWPAYRRHVSDAILALIGGAS